MEITQSTVQEASMSNFTVSPRASVPAGSERPVERRRSSVGSGLMDQTVESSRFTMTTISSFNETHESMPAMLDARQVPGAAADRGHEPGEDGDAVRASVAEPPGPIHGPRAPGPAPRAADPSHVTRRAGRDCGDPPGREAGAVDRGALQANDLGGEGSERKGPAGEEGQNGVLHVEGHRPGVLWDVDLHEPHLLDAVLLGHPLQHRQHALGPVGPCLQFLALAPGVPEVDGCVARPERHLLVSLVVGRPSRDHLHTLAGDYHGPHLDLHDFRPPGAAAEGARSDSPPPIPEGVVRLGGGHGHALGAWERLATSALAAAAR
eukprot:CAMPEP_0179258574 /NCGR_PEP_ID=MMETSP0797-20121207/25385_1 /TAXON_ID=47934 /ORGANISM="Dinophysis acuminata, Strain DAEP01" /LENGTH=320 /DNA_ID=CAMNT_0020966609 /DNA_START=68 /DNA_END=1026 /DNA_ORIENTATION=-